MVSPARCWTTVHHWCQMGIDMDVSGRVGAAQSGPAPEVRGRDQSVTWWWHDRVRIHPRRGVLHAWLVGWTGVPLAYASMRSSQPLSMWIPTDWEVLAMSLLRKEDLEGRGGSGPRVLTDPRFSGDYPILWSYMTQTKWQDGSARATSSLLLFADDGVLKAMLRDRDAGLCLWVAGATVTGLFDALEAAVSDSRADWRQDRVKPGDQARRKRPGS